MDIDDSLRRSAARKCVSAHSKGYQHFDLPLGKAEIKQLLSPGEHSFMTRKFVENYRHFPLIRFDQRFNKYGKTDDDDGKHVYIKVRPISVTSHHEALLLKYYAEMLSAKYEAYIQAQGIADVPIAYRKGHSNISGAKKVFDFIWKSENAWIIKGDFHAFFDCLDHRVLLRQVKTVLTGTENGRIPEDWMTVIRLVTKYRTVEQDELERVCRGSMVKYPYAQSIAQFGQNVKAGKIHVSKPNKLGIPQGTAISAVLANVYMVRFDKQVQNMAAEYGGIYRRYSDDFVVVVPKSQCSLPQAEQLRDLVINKSKRDLRVTINRAKTRLLDYSKSSQHVLDVAKRSRPYDKQIRNFDYLGFEFTGKTVIFRAKTLYKFHYRGEKALAILARGMLERKIVKLGYEQEYINSKVTMGQIRRATQRIAETKEAIAGGHGVRGRKRFTQMYLVQKPLPKKNMYAYAERAQRIMSAEIPGVDTLYDVHIEKKIQKEISRFQRYFGEKRDRVNRYS
ncbi:reverse transcriptase/maturase family protein [Levilactobacillus sp. HBUAS70063]|uniref:reverse transcriptase/maturase family protein n=1 Tax=Levilactobacillus sp. HBUAS70063 TaxID=3109359 RepID=UPI003133185A